MENQENLSEYEIKIEKIKVTSVIVQINIVFFFFFIVYRLFLYL